jgi:hypothetical protein
VISEPLYNSRARRGRGSSDLQWRPDRLRRTLSFGQGFELSRKRSARLFSERACEPSFEAARSEEAQQGAEMVTGVGQRMRYVSRREKPCPGAGGDDFTPNLERQLTFENIEPLTVRRVHMQRRPTSSWRHLHLNDT